jgi:hypothetical protein
MIAEVGPFLKSLLCFRQPILIMQDESKSVMRFSISGPKQDSSAKGSFRIGQFAL